jgi:hypothetical protein
MGETEKMLDQLRSAGSVTLVRPTLVALATGHAASFASRPAVDRLINELDRHVRMPNVTRALWRHRYAARFVVFVVRRSRKHRGCPIDAPPARRTVVREIGPSTDALIAGGSG